MRAFEVLTVLALLAVVGCDERTPAKATTAPQSSGFETDEPTSGPSVFLRGRVEAPHLVLDLVASGATNEIHGAAFRLSWDPDKLAFVEAHGSHAWSKQSVQLAKEASPGELLVVWTEKGAVTAIPAGNETILGSIAYTLKTHEPTTVAFRPDRCTLRDAKGTPIPVSWRGGRLTGQAP
ncbi:MAG TPA: cohesin domain-containing protein [Labilithrix sp.]|nr:cohesin domain-containing protein [Labilithrix sp.]